MHGEDQRRFARVLSRLSVDLRTVDGIEVVGELDNLSMRGIFLRTDAQIAPGTACAVTLHLGGRGSGLALEAHGEIAHAAPDGVGIRFDEVAYEAFEHVRNLAVNAFVSGGSGPGRGLARRSG